MDGKAVVKPWEFSKQHTNAVKAVAIIGILFHHLFMGASADWGVSFDVVPVQRLALFMKMGVAVFVFLSAFGLTKTWNSMGESPDIPFPNRCSNWLKTRYVKLMSGFWFVYILAVIISSFTTRTPAIVYGTEKFPWLCAVADFFGLANFFGVTLLNETWWYMSLAIVVMVCVPLLAEGEKNFGIVLLFFCAMVPNYVFQAYSVPADYILPAILGVFSAQNNFLERVHLKKLTGVGIIDALLKLAVCVGLIWLMYQIRLYYGRVYVVDGVAAFSLTVGVMELIEIRWMKPLKYVLGFIGKHSMNIFLVHTFIFSYYFTDFIYSFRTPAAITAVLLAASLLVSFVIEGLKKLLRYDVLTDYLSGKIQTKQETI